MTESFYPIFLIPPLVGLVTQILKFFVTSWRKKGLKIEYFFTHGYMPSSHSALAISLATVAYYFEGLDSVSFAISFVLAFIIIDDALRLRFYLGQHGKIINSLIYELPPEKIKKYPHLKEVLGHRPEEVIMGAIIGFLLTIVFINFGGF